MMSSLDEILDKREGTTDLPGVMRVRGSQAQPSEPDPLLEAERQLERAKARQLREKTLQIQEARLDLDLERNRMALERARQPQTVGDESAVKWALEHARTAVAESNQVREKYESTQAQQLDGLSRQVGELSAKVTAQQNPAEQANSIRALLQAVTALNEAMAPLMPKPTEVDLDARRLDYEERRALQTMEMEDRRAEREFRRELAEKEMEREKLRDQRLAFALHEVSPALKQITSDVSRRIGGEESTAPSSNRRVWPCQRCGQELEIPDPPPSTITCPKCSMVWALMEDKSEDQARPTEPKQTEPNGDGKRRRLPQI